MLISKLASRMPIWFESQTPYEVIGASGMGKTSIVMDAPNIVKQATGKEIGVVVFNAATYTPMHLLGFGVVRHYEDHSQMLFSDPFFWVTAEGKRLEDYKDGGIIFVDESDKGDPDVMKNLGEMGYSKRIGTHQLPPGWVVWMAGNPSDARFGSKKKLDYLINREITIYVKHDPEGWETWGIQNHLLPETMAFAREYKHIVFSEELPAKQGPWCTPRSLVTVDRLLQTTMQLRQLKAPPFDEDTIEEAEGGMGAAAQPYFTQLRQSTSMPTVPEAVADPMGCKLPSTDTMALFCYRAAFAATPGNISKLIQYVDRLPKEFASTFMKATITKNAKLITNAAVNDWAQKNAGLLLILNRYAPTA